MEIAQDALKAFSDYKEDNQFLQNYRKWKDNYYNKLKKDEILETYYDMDNYEKRKVRIQGCLQAAGFDTPSILMEEHLNKHYEMLKERRVKKNRITENVEEYLKKIHQNVNEIDEINDQSTKKSENSVDHSKRLQVVNCIVDLQTNVENLEIFVRFAMEFVGDYDKISNKINGKFHDTIQKHALDCFKKFESNQNQS